jgi:hypothetical protein
MPRLVGRQSNNSWYAGLFLIFVIAAAAVSLEFLGFINIIPGFGRDYRSNDQSQLQLRH